MSNTSQIPEGDQDLVADFMARFTKESASLIEADFLAEFDIRFSVENESYRLQLTRVNNSPSQKDIKVLEQTIQDQDRQIIELKKLIKIAFGEFQYRPFPHNEPTWEQFCKANNIQDKK